ncbi:hypothetical protein HBI56_024310 [Parastagonospora nodorum]|uniref:MARVEL domain-containing protein n=2 Tax=Phaeosphaeria nodorum (strain SN15 / ATCC MYA-4574 / FGSC 10173) TaxID=321614 RepID=A0A7U2I1W9_PHANO|nr:hypothetical protein SNOG_06147 [Parastagonospora nodorum SN15]KAH3918742.1 hypothetical protein HBH56_024200 [Parastagonospora nodorum]EAT85978.1 hypothetical protein SNOG_06147 [Parastagonospora nodorum SN15]KAH3934115.1 hypothetical protein HBH54_057820 [Parastagonospora nodorum]KAH3949962.1 hypothetical protein HBH53_085510 [Parastagonospora nodorum]KAH3975937.1 hypothetical protein HBH51_079860 [Parastagonospora nodorum]
MAATQQPVLWKKRILVPFWIVRICLMLFIIAAYSWTLRHLNEIKDVIKPAVASVVVFMLFIVIVLLIDVLAIVLFLRDALKPATFLTMNCFQTGFWGGVLILDLVSVARGASSVAIGFSVFVFTTFVGLLIYAAVGYSRAKKAAQRGMYAPAHNPAVHPAPYGQPPQYQSGASPYQQNTEYHSQTAPVELHDQYLPPYQGGAATDYYHQQPAKPAHLV